MIDLELNEFQDEGLNIGQGNYGNGSNDHSENGVEDLPMAMPRGNELEPRGDPQPQLIRREYLCERLWKMKLPSFEGSANPLDAEKWLSSMETILDFMKLDDGERIIYVAYMLRREAHYWWKSIKARRNVRVMLYEDFVYEFNKKFFNPTALSAQQTEFLNFK